MPRLRRLAPWLLAAIALAAALAPHVPKDILTPPRIALALALLLTVLLACALVVLLRRRRTLPKPPPDPTLLNARQAQRALERSLAAARRLLGGDPARTWLLLGPAQHGKSTLAAALLGELHDVTAPASPARCLVARETRTLVLEHPPAACDLRPLLALRRPLDAILLVVSLPDLATLDLPPLRTRLRDLHTTLAVDVPIHLVCTRLDHLAGHHELVGDDPAPWGLALASLDHLPAALRTWSRWVDAQRLARLAAEPDQTRRARLFTFAAAFAAACDLLTDLTPLFAPPDPSAKPLPLRTVFFTATRRAASPADRVLHQLASQLHLPLHHPTTTTHDPHDLLPQPALLTALLAHDREVTRTPAHQRRRALRTHAAAAALALVAAAVAVAAPTSATRERTCLQDLADRTAPLVDPTPDPTTTQAHLAALHALHAALAAPGCADPSVLDATFRRATRRLLLRDVHAALAHALARLATHPPVTVTEQVAARDALRAYLLLTADLSETPGPFDPAQKTWLTTDLAARSPANTAPLLATFLARATATDLAFPRDPALVQQVRAQLGAHSDDDATLHAALAAADAACEPLALRALTHATQLVGDRTLPCSFTRPGWDIVQQQLSAAVDQHDHWILGRSQEPRDARLARLRDRYDARYIQAWTDFLAAVRVRRPTDQPSAARLLAELTADDHPLSRLFSGLEHHTRGLGRSRADIPSLLRNAPELTPTGEVHRAFAPLLAFTVPKDREPGLARWHARLAEVLAALESARSDPAALPALRTQISTALADTQTLLRHADIRRFRPLLTDLLLPPLEALQAAVTDQDKLTLLRSYCHELHAPLRHLAARYPFDRTSPDDATLADFTALFHPETGAIARLRDGDLAPYLTGQALDLSARTAPRSDPHPLHPRVVSLLRRAATLASLTFLKGQLSLDLDVDLRCNADISRVTLMIGQSHHSYACGPNPRARMHWPAAPDAKQSDNPEGANLELLGRDGRRQQLPGHGPWGLFRLLEKDDVVTPPTDATADPLVFRFDLRATRLGTLDLALTPTRTAGATVLFGQSDQHPPSLLAPLRARELLDPPDTLFQGLPGCPDLDP